MNFIYILLIIERNKDAKLITMTLSQFIDLLTINLTEELPPEIDALYQHYSDMICLYYISYLNKLEKNETTKEFKKLLKLLFSKPNNDRDIIFADNLNTIFNQEKRSNINKEDVIKNINQFFIFFAHNIFPHCFYIVINKKFYFITCISTFYNIFK